MRNISKEDVLSFSTENREKADAIAEDLRRFDELLTAIGRRWSVRDPIFTLLEELSLTPAQLHTIIWLGKERELTMGVLAERLKVSEKTVTGLVDRLVRDGLVIRKRDDSDRRRVVATLTDEGGDMFLQLSQRFEERLATMLGLIDDDDREALFRVMEKLAFADFEEER